MGNESLRDRSIKIIAGLKRGDGDVADLDPLIDEIQAAMQDNPQSRKELGTLIGQIKGLQKTLNSDANPIKLINVLGGGLSVGHRPRKKHYDSLKAQGVTHILTLLSEREGAKEIQRDVEKADLLWLWLPMPSAEPPSDDMTDNILNLFEVCANELESGAKIYIHCSAGIHRTGMIAYALLRFMKYDAVKAIKLLSQMRTVTGEGVGEQRTAWGDRFIQDLSP